MSFSRLFPTGKAFGDKFAASELTQLDIDHANALDKTNDTVSGTINWANGSKIVAKSGARVEYETGSVQELKTGSTTIVRPNATIRLDPGGTINSAGLLTGTLSVNNPGSQIVTSSGGRFVLGDNDWVQFSVARTRSIEYYLAHLGHIKSSGTGTFAITYDGSSIFGVKSLTAANGSFDFILPHGHSGATLNSVDVWFYASSGHVALPAGQPSLAVQRSSAWTQYDPVVAGVYLSTSVIQQNAAPTLASYNGKIQKMTYVCNQNNVLDYSQYHYLVTVYDEGSTNALPGNNYVKVVMNFSNITDTHFA